MSVLVTSGGQKKETNEIQRRTRRLTGQEGRKVGVLRVGISPVKALLQVLGDRRPSQSGYVEHGGWTEERFVGRPNVVVPLRRFGSVPSNDEDVLETVDRWSEERLPAERPRRKRQSHGLMRRKGREHTMAARPQATGCRPGRSRVASQRLRTFAKPKIVELSAVCL